MTSIAVYANVTVTDVGQNVHNFAEPQIWLLHTFFCQCPLSNEYPRVPVSLFHLYDMLYLRKASTYTVHVSG